MKVCDDSSLFNRCHELFDEVNGVLFRKKTVASNAVKGSVAGWLDCGKDQYYKVKVDKKQYLELQGEFSKYFCDKE